MVHKARAEQLRNAAERLGISASEVIERLIELGIEHNVIPDELPGSISELNLGQASEAFSARCTWRSCRLSTPAYSQTPFFSMPPKRVTGATPLTEPIPGSPSATVVDDDDIVVLGHEGDEDEEPVPTLLPAARADETVTASSEMHADCVENS